MKSQRILVHNLGFFGANFQSKCLGRFCKMNDYFLCILVAVCHKRSVVSMNLLSEHFWSSVHSIGLPFFSIPWAELVKASDKSIGRKIKNNIGALTQSCFFPFPTSNGSKSSPPKLTDAFIHVCKVDSRPMNWSGNLCSLGCSIALSYSQYQRLLCSILFFCICC